MAVDPPPCIPSYLPGSARTIFSLRGQTGAWSTLRSCSENYFENSPPAPLTAPDTHGNIQLARVQLSLAGQTERTLRIEYRPNR